MTAILPLPDEQRLLRGIDHALAGLDLAQRPDLAHVIAQVRMNVGHLLARRDLSSFAALHGELRDLAEQRGKAIPQNLDLSGGYDHLAIQFAEAFGSLLPEIGKNADSFATQLQSVEARFYAATLPVFADPDNTSPVPLTREAVTDYLEKHCGQRWRNLVDFRRLVGGFQKETLVLEAETVGGARESLVMRAEKHDRFVTMTASAIPDEFAIVQLMHARGVPVAEPLWLEADASRLGRRFFLSRRAEGSTVGAALGAVRALSEPLRRSFMTVLAQIHNTPLDAEVRTKVLGGWMQHRTLADNTRALIALWRHQTWLDRAPPSPAFMRIFDWLETNVPQEDEPSALLHGDFGTHNVLCEDDRVSAVLDWEIARVGDPAEDLSFFVHTAAGQMDRSEAIAAYQQVSGRVISDYRMRYFDVLNLAKVLVSTLSATTMYQLTDPAQIDWVQMPVLWHSANCALVESAIAAAEASRNGA